MEQIVKSYYSNNAKKLRKMVDNILFKLKFDVDNEDFYCLANEVFTDALKRYNKSQPFDGFLYSCLMNKFKTEMTRRNRQKRKTDKMTISIDTPVLDGKYTLGDILTDDDTIEKCFFENGDEYSPKMDQYLNRLSLLQREVLRLISIGFIPSEIIKELHINKRQYDDCYAAIHSYRNISILM